MMVTTTIDFDEHLAYAHCRPRKVARSCEHVCEWPAKSCESAHKKCECVDFSVNAPQKSVNGPGLFRD